MMVHFSVSVLLNTLNLKVNSFVPYYIHTIECVQHMSGMPNMESLSYGGKAVKLLIVLYQGQYLSVCDKLF